MRQVSLVVKYIIQLALPKFIVLNQKGEFISA